MIKILDLKKGYSDKFGNFFWRKIEIPKEVVDSGYAFISIDLDLFHGLIHKLEYLANKNMEVMEENLNLKNKMAMFGIDHSNDWK